MTLTRSFEEEGASHVSLLGSARRAPIGEARDVDVYVLWPTLDAGRFARVVALAEVACRALGSGRGGPFRLETRRGPFHPDPEEGVSGQLHLVIESRASMLRLPAVLAEHYRDTALVLGGAPLVEMVPPRTEAERTASMVEELLRVRAAVVKDELPYRAWQLTPEPELRDLAEPVRSAWSMRALLRCAAMATDTLFFRLFADRAEALARIWAGRLPLSAQIAGDLDDWKGLPERWSARKTSVLDTMDHRLSALAAG